MIVELQGKSLKQGLDPPQWMKVGKVKLLKTETTCYTRVAIARRKQAIDLGISALPLSEAADNFLVHLRDSPAGPAESARDHIHRTIPKVASWTAWILPQVSDDELQVYVFLECEPSRSAIWQRIVLLYSLMQ